MHVVIVNDSSVARGGATGLALLSARLLRARGIGVTYVCGDAGANPELAAAGVEIVAFEGNPLVQAPPLRAATAGLYNAAAAALLRGVVARRDGPRTVYHVHGWSKILSPGVFAALRPVAARTVIHAHDFFLACPNGAFMDYRAGRPCDRRPLGAGCLATHCDKRSYPQKLWRVARQAVLDRTLGADRDFAAVAMIHPRMAPFLEAVGFPAERLVTLRNPAVPFLKARVAAEANRKLFFIGRIEAEKGLPELLAAARRTGVPACVIGEGPLRAELAATHPEVRFTGWRSREEIGALLGSARAVAMPTRYPEPFGLVAAEASRSGVPVILPRTAFLADEIARGGLGVVYDPQDAEGLDAALAAIRDMPAAEIAAMSRGAFVGETPLASTPDAWADALVALYASTVAPVAIRAAAR